MAPEVGDICSHLSSHMEGKVILTLHHFGEGIINKSTKASEGRSSQHDLLSK